MANETYWELTFIDTDNIEKTERFTTEEDYTNKFMSLYVELKLPIISSTSGSNA
jgi:hypothetical protein